MSRVLSAVAWPYANGPRHIGHVAGFRVPSDVFSRYMRMAGGTRGQQRAAQPGYGCAARTSMPSCRLR